MPVQSIDVRDGDPRQQASGEYRGTVDALMTDGRTITKNLRAPTLDAWNDLIANLAPIVVAEVAESDAVAGVSPDQEITSNGEATIKQRAVAYLRKAMEQDSAYEGFRLLDRFNTYRLAQGWNLNQVQAGLAEAGLTEDEWDEMRAAYQYLSSAGRPAIMNDYQTIQAQWEAR